MEKKSRKRSQSPESPELSNKHSKNKRPRTGMLNENLIHPSSPDYEPRNFISLRGLVAQELSNFLLPELAGIALAYIKEHEILVAEYGVKGQENGKLNNPHEAAILSSGEIAVTDARNYRIQVFSTEGKFARAFGSKGTGNGEFLCPWGIACMLSNGKPSGEIIVSDLENHCLQVFTAEGKFMKRLGSYGQKDGEFNHPQGIACLPSGEIIVADSKNHRIQVLTPEGKFIRKWGSQGREAGEFNLPGGISYFTTGKTFSHEEVRVVVSDSQNHRIQIFTVEGKFIAKWGSYYQCKGKGKGEGRFDFPTGVACRRTCIYPSKSLYPVSKTGKIYKTEIIVVDTFNLRFQVFTTEGEFLRKWEGSSSISQSNSAYKKCRTFDAPCGITLLPSQIINVSKYNSEFQQNLKDPFVTNSRFYREDIVIVDAGKNCFQVFTTILN